ncbi:MAG: hypothetical protein M1827_003425 [Pycnora praestabilis]|nr:MAG: hypothetical protein M1827_003425 [Pycnora praestabilis]
MNDASKSLIDFFKGWPNPSLLPAAQIKRASDSVLSNPSVSTPALLYGPDPGYEPLREQIAQWLTKFYTPKEIIPPSRICITGGASQNMACVLQVYSDPIYTRNVWMVAPTYYLACRIFEDAGFYGKLRDIPEDEEGIELAHLKKEMNKSEQKAKAEGNNKPTLKPSRQWSKIYRHIIYAVPTFANPSSKTMTMRRRQELIRIAREYDALVITDDVYDFLQWPTATTSQQLSLDKAVLPRLVDVDRQLDGGPKMAKLDGFGNAISNGSFSKIVGPGCRTGWAEGTEKFVHGLSQTIRGSSRSGGAPSQLTATFITELLRTGNLQDHILRTLQPTYARRYRKMILAIDEHLVPLGVMISQSGREVVGGYFIWFSLPKPLRAEEVAATAKDTENLIISPGPAFRVDKAMFESEIRVCFSWEKEEKLSEGIQRLANVIRNLLDSGSNPLSFEI